MEVRKTEIYRMKQKRMEGMKQENRHQETVGGKKEKRKKREHVGLQMIMYTMQCTGNYVATKSFWLKLWDT
jgi:hypothetical protein